MDTQSTTVDTAVPPRTREYPEIFLFDGETAEEVFAGAARSGLYTPEELQRYRENGIRPAQRHPRVPEELVVPNPRWLSFLLRTFDWIVGRR